MQRIIVRTPYSELDEAIDRLSGAVAAERITLLWHAVVAPGEWVSFALSLADGRPVLEGVGVCDEMIDLGADAQPAGRYRLMLTSLELDQANALMHDRIVRARFRAASRRVVSMLPPVPTPASRAPSRVFGRPSEAPPELDPDFETVPPPRRSASYPPNAVALSLDIPPALAHRAEQLIPRLIELRGVAVLELPSTTSVLRHALRIGLAALEAQVDPASRPDD